MARNLGTALQSARREFAVLLGEHLRLGQRADTPPKRWKPWTDTDFARATDASPNSPANWRKGISLPADILPILDALFGDKPEFSNRRRELKEAWERARGDVPPEEPDVSEAWEITRQEAHTEMAHAILHQPTPANQRDSYLLNATLRFGSEEFTEGDRTVVVGLREAVLFINGSGYQIAQNSLLGERTPMPHIDPDGTRLIIKGPVVEGRLKGNPVGEDHLGIVEPGAPGDGTVSIRLCAGQRAFTFFYAPDPDAPLVRTNERPNRAAILDLLAGQVLNRDEHGRFILATAGLRRRSLK